MSWSPGTRLRPSAIAATTVLVVLSALLVSCRSAEPPVEEFTIAQAEFQAFYNSPPAISPDGTAIVFAAGRPIQGQRRLWLRSFGEDQARLLPGTDEATYPFWAPDGREVGFFAGNRLKKIDITSQVVEDISYLPGAGRGGTWNDAGDILFAVSGGALYLMPARGGGPDQLTHVDAWARKQMPQFLPDGRRFIFFTRAQDWHAPGIAIASLDSQESAFVIESDSNGRYVDPGFLLFVRDGTLLGQTFDGDDDEAPVSGDAFVVAENLDPLAGGLFDVSSNGVLTFRAGGVSEESVPTWFDRDGRELGQALPAGVYLGPVLSRTDDRLAVYRLDMQTRMSSIWVFDIDEQQSSQLTSNGGMDSFPVFSPDGSQVAFSSVRDGEVGLYVGASTEPDTEQLLAVGNAWRPSDWSPDGRYILFSPAPGRIAALPTDGVGAAIPIGRGDAREGTGRFSPDGHWVAYERAESGVTQTVVTSFPATFAQVFPVSSEGGTQPFWRDDGREIYFVSPEGRIMAAPVLMDGETVMAGDAEPLLQLPMGAVGGGSYVASADGQRFLVLIPTRTDSSLRVVVNWPAALDAAPPAR